MTHVNMEELKTRVFFKMATLDDRYVWEEIVASPDNESLVGIEAVDITQMGELPERTYIWADGATRYRIARCAHREMDRHGDLCGHCGVKNPYEPPAQTAARKRAPRKRGKK
jgi:hypothetical protein